VSHPDLLQYLVVSYFCFAICQPLTSVSYDQLGDLVRRDWVPAHQNITSDTWSLLIVFGVFTIPRSISRAVEDFQGCLEVRRFQSSKFHSWV
jgi:hypothetical protein